VIIKPQEIQIELAREQITNASGEGLDPTASLAHRSPAPVLIVRWNGVNGAEPKGIVQASPVTAPMAPSNRDQLLLAIAKARAWIADLVEGRAASFAQIAAREGKAERYIRFLAPLAFLSPRIVHSIADGSLRADLSITKLANSIECSWAEQERAFSIATNVDGTDCARNTRKRVPSRPAQASF
jgi:hypothetical protein